MGVQYYEASVHLRVFQSFAALSTFRRIPNSNILVGALVRMVAFATNYPAFTAVSPLPSPVR
jgi:hypothetical protein